MVFFTSRNDYSAACQTFLCLWVSEFADSERCGYTHHTAGDERLGVPKTLSQGQPSYSIIPVEHATYTPSEMYAIRTDPAIVAKPDAII